MQFVVGILFLKCLLQVLRPFSNISNLKIWEYYLTEDMSSGTPYDCELLEGDLRSDEEQEAEHAAVLGSRRIINGCYDNIMLLEPAACSQILQVSSPVFIQHGF